MSERINYQEREETPLSSTNLRIFKMLECINSDYITFILGFISSIVINDFYGIFNLKVSEDRLNFYFMLAECILLAVTTAILLAFSIDFAKMQRELALHRTTDARQNYFREKMIGTRTTRFTGRLVLICVLSIFTLALNIVKFCIINI